MLSHLILYPGLFMARKGDATMSDLLAARATMGTTLAFHMIFSALGVGMPFLLCAAEGLGLRTGDTVWYALARRWSQAFSILFIVGAVSGTALSFEFGLLWPRFMGYASGVIGLPFALEGFAFFTEGIFLGLYLYGWDRLSPRAHWLCSLRSEERRVGKECRCGWARERWKKSKL